MAKENEEERTVAEDYFAINARNRSCWLVRTPMARHVLLQLDRVIPPRWIHFVDMSGASVRIRPAEIIAVTQCSAEQRAARRAFDEALDKEEGGRW